MDDVEVLRKVFELVIAHLCPCSLGRVARCSKWLRGLVCDSDAAMSTAWFRLFVSTAGPNCDLPTRWNPLTWRDRFRELQLVNVLLQDHHRESVWYYGVWSAIVCPQSHTLYIASRDGFVVVEMLWSSNGWFRFRDSKDDNHPGVPSVMWSKGDRSREALTDAPFHEVLLSDATPPPLPLYPGLKTRYAIENEPLNYANEDEDFLLLDVTEDELIVHFVAEPPADRVIFPRTSNEAVFRGMKLNDIPMEGAQQ